MYYILFLTLIFALVSAEIHNICDLNVTNAPKHTLSLCTMIHNEGQFIEEWIAHHLLMRVDHFYIYDDQSTDNTKQVLQPYIKQGMLYSPPLSFFPFLDSLLAHTFTSILSQKNLFFIILVRLIPWHHQKQTVTHLSL